MATTETLAPVDEWVTAFQHDLDVFRRWAADPKVTGLRSRIVGNSFGPSITCTDRQDYEHVLLLLAATGVTAGPESLDATARFVTAKFGKYVALLVRCPRSDA